PPPAACGVLGVRAAGADVLIVVVEADLVALRQLRRHSRAADLSAARRTRLDALIDHVVPLGRITRVQVPESPGDVGVLAEGPPDGVEPHAITPDRPAHL